MPWSDADFIGRLETAVQQYDRAEATRLCNALIAELTGGRELDEPIARRILQTLRRKCYFELMERVAESLVFAGQDSPQIRRQFAQSLIDQGKLGAAVSALEALVQRGTDPVEIVEAQGLIGRVHKQVYVNAADPASRRNQMSLRKAISAYDTAYRSAPDTHLWHGINTVALSWRARRDLITVDAAPDPVTMAREILERIAVRASRGRVDTWDLATAAEASLAVGKPDDAKRWLEEYVRRDDADAFEIGSTLRQLREVWLLTVGTEPGATLLPLLSSHLLEKTGGQVDVPPSEVNRTIERVAALEKVLGRDGVVTLAWYRQGLERCRSVAQVRTTDGEGYGTGFLVRGRDLAPALGEEIFLLTNAHVISTNPDVKDALLPEEAVIAFEAQEKPAAGAHRVAGVLWTSPPGDLPTDLDATLLRLHPAITDVAVSPIAPRLPIADGTQKVYVIGHPGGRGLSFSLHDNLLLDHDDRLLHYRAPTEGGSSGSPVFNQQWALIGLHHAGGLEMRRLNGKAGTYAANEGIRLHRIQERLQAEGIKA